MKEIRPYHDESGQKSEQVAKMFDNIASQYDLLNTVLSAGIHKRWHKQLVKTALEQQPMYAIDLATGTADVAIALAQASKGIVIKGIDLSNEMLAIGRKKVHSLELDHRVSLQEGNGEDLPIPDATYDLATIAFGIRNYQNPMKGLREAGRILKPGGKLAILEFSRPRSFPFNKLYNFYFSNVLPLIGRLGSGDRDAYHYLFKSVRAFPDFDNFARQMEAAGFQNVEYKSLTFGICCIYSGYKSQS